jgi:hypothetical protein
VQLIATYRASGVEDHGGYAMSFYLGIWKSATAISDDEAAAQYLALRDEKSVESEFDDKVYSFYCRLTSLYPEVEMVPEDELDSCPWAGGIDIAGGHVILAIQPEQSEKVVPQVMVLAEQHELVCFDPQAGKVYLPPHLSGSSFPRPGLFGNEPEPFLVKDAGPTG